MKVVCSKTGSDGNFSLIYDGKSFMSIDCGIPWEKANKISKYKVLNSSCCLVTHQHTDHSAFIKQFIEKGINIYACNETWLKCQISRAYDRKKHFIDGNQINVGSYAVKPFKVPHANSDGTPCENYGFLIYSKETKEKMLWITDCAYIENKFPVCDYICIECNYIDVDDYSQELEYINKSVEKRRFRSHLSLSRCVSFLKMQDLSKIKQIRLLHLTKTQGIIENTIKQKFKEEFPNIEVII